MIATRTNGTADSRPHAANGQDPGPAPSVFQTLEELCDRLLGEGGAPLYLRVRRGGLELRLAVGPARESAGEQRRSLTESVGLTTSERQVLAVATFEAATAQKLANLARLSLNYVRAAVSSLCDKGLLERAKHGLYRLKPTGEAREEA